MDTPEATPGPTPGPTPDPTRRGARIDESRRLGRGRLVALAAGAIVLVSLVVAGVAQVMAGGAFTGDAAETVTGPLEASSSRSTFTPEPQPVVQAQRLEPQQAPAKAGRQPAQGGKAGSLATQAERVARGLPAVQPETFTVASFNMLGNSHTTGKNGRRGFGSGSARAAQAASLVSALGLDVVGAQEFEPVQQSTFLGRLPHFAVYPGQSLSVIDGTNSIAWNTNEFRLVDARTIGIPYFGGKLVQMPYVLLEQVSTGQQVWFANFHNPADVHGAAGTWRLQATALEADLAAELHATGLPVVMTGDFNEHATFYCRLAAAAPMISSASGAVPGPPCSVPSRPRVDWVLGSTPVSFANYRELDGGVVDAITDHPVIVADATVQPAS